MVTARSGRSIGNTGSIKWRHGLGTLLLFLLCRKKGILDEVRHYAADIIAMQEVEIVPQIIALTRFEFKVETDQFYKFFLPELKRDG